MNSLWQRIRPYLSTTLRFFRISYLEAKSDYEGTRIGLLWIPLSTLIFTGLLGLVFHNPGAMSQANFFLYVLSGYVCWMFISDTISGSVSIIQSKLDFAVHSGLSLGALFAKTLCDRLFEYGINLTLLVAGLAILSPSSFLGWPLLLYPLLLGMLAATSLAISYLVNLLTLFFPDLSTIVRTGARVMFFGSPVFWNADNASGVRGVLERYNPAAYYLKMSRQVFGIDPIGWHIWGVGLVITLVACAAGYIAFQRSESFVRNMK